MRHDNLTIIETTDKDSIIRILRDCGIEGGHFTNGTYSGPTAKIIPTTLAGFEFINNTHFQKGDALIIAVNSNDSMETLLQLKEQKASTEHEKAVVAADRDALEDQAVRAGKVALPLAMQHAPAGTNVVVMYYDEETPNALYDFLATNGFGMKSLHKWGGYGLDKKAVIEGAELFGKVLAFPFFNKDEPMAMSITRTGDQTDIVQRVNLYRNEDGHPAYLSEDGKIRFNIRNSLASYAAQYLIVDGQSRQLSP